MRRGRRALGADLSAGGTVSIGSKLGLDSKLEDEEQIQS